MDEWDGRSKHCPSAEVGCRFCRTNFMWKSPPQSCYSVGQSIFLEQKPAGSQADPCYFSCHTRMQTCRDSLLPPSVSQGRAPTKRAENFLTASDLRDFSSTTGGSADPWKQGISQHVTPVWLFRLSWAGACWTLWLILVKHTQPFQTFTGESIYCLHLTLFSVFFSGEPWQWNRFQEDPKASPPPAWCFPGTSSVPGRVRSVQGRLWSKKLGWTNQKELQTRATWSSDGALHLQAASWECGSFSRTGKPARGVTGTVSYRFLFSDQLPC